MEQLTKLYTEWAGQAPAHVEKIAGAGSNRQYYRLTAPDGSTVVGVIGTSKDEDHAFITICRHFNERHLPVPRLLAVSDDEMRYLQSDLVTGRCLRPSRVDVRPVAVITLRNNGC